MPAPMCVSTRPHRLENTLKDVEHAHQQMISATSVGTLRLGSTRS